MPSKSSPTLPPSGNVPTQRAAAKILGITTKTLRAFIAEGCPGASADGHYDVGAIWSWMQANGKGEGKQKGNWRDKLDREKWVKLQLQNDKTRGLLIERSYMAERIAVAAGMFESARLKSEAEHPLRFAAANGDVAKCREVVRGIWDDIALAMNGLKEAFRPAPTPPAK